MQIVTPKLYNWASDIDEGTIQQALKASRLPIISGHIALMSDAHVGMGATIGSVIATENAIIPSAAGTDLGCGMNASLTNLRANDLPDTLNRLHEEISRSVPGGVGKGFRKKLPAAEAWFAKNPPKSELGAKLSEQALTQFGTLGSGNHFIEVCLDEQDRVWVVLHSGSRGVGNRLASKHIDAIKTKFRVDLNDLMKEEHSLKAKYGAGVIADPSARLQEIESTKKTLQLEDPDLAYLIQGTPEFDSYITDMLWAQDYAFGNRDVMTANVLRQLFAIVGHGEELRRIRCHHNYASLEEHEGKTLWITRKGAIESSSGMLGVIPGSMGTSSYIVRGLGNPLSYNSSSHGAGRKMSRGQAKRTITEEELKTAMVGRTWNERDVKSLIDEAPQAYKDINTVMSDQSDLTQIVHTLVQVLNYKGT